MSFLEELGIQRRKFLEGLDANEGDINLDIFEDFYPDKAHFIFELLQNAEDAGATKVLFSLTPEGCSFEHDGNRCFSEDNVRAITGIHNSTKSKNPDQIGKFGIGFKSVFVYTLTPQIHSGDFSFQISRLVYPEILNKEKDLSNKTKFVLPFNNPKKQPKEAFDEISEGLEGLAETTLLFLTGLESICWNISGKTSGEVLRIEHSQNIIEVLKIEDGKKRSNSHFLRFASPVEGLEHHDVAIAYELDFLPNVRGYDAKQTLSKQLKIIPANPGRVAVFSPAEKESSGLRFHLHAPFVPELSRASIKETPVNNPLFVQLAKLISSSLYSIRDLKMLTGDFLSVLPNSHDKLLKRYEPIRDAIIAEMNHNPLTPTYLGKKHLPAKNLIQARVSLKTLLTGEDLKSLIGFVDVAPHWAIGAQQKNSNVDRFLSDLAIKEWGLETFVKMLQEKTTEEVRYIPPTYKATVGQDADFMNWLGAQSEGWHQKFYALLQDEYLVGSGYLLNKLIAKFKPLRIVRLSDGSYTVGQSCYFPTSGEETDKIFSRVAKKVYTSGKNKTQQALAFKFLESIGVSEVGEADQVRAILKERYAIEENTLTSRSHCKDLKRFISMVEKDSHQANLFADYFIFKQQNGSWCCPGKIYLDKPFADSDLKEYYDALGDDAKRTALSEEYANIGLNLESLKKFAVTVGAQVEMKLIGTTCSSNSKKNYLYGKSSLRRSNQGIDRDWYFPALKQVIDLKNFIVARLIWKTMCDDSKNKLEAVFRWNASDDTRRAPALILNWLSSRAWIPLTDGRFVKPQNASRELLLDGFPFDESQAWLKEIRFGEEVRLLSEESQKKKAAAKELLGTDDPNLLEDAKWFATLSEEERLNFKNEYKNKHTTDLPDSEPRNPELRAKRVGEQATDAPDRTKELRLRAVSTGLGDVKLAAEKYLRQQYTNEDDEMICQICKAPLPFKLDDDTYYFEKIQFLPDLEKRHYQNYIALCPNHAAMFQYANDSSGVLRDLIAEMSVQDVPVQLARQDLGIYFTKLHFLDLKTIIDIESGDGSDSFMQSSSEKSLSKPNPPQEPEALINIKNIEKVPVINKVVYGGNIGFSQKKLQELKICPYCNVSISEKKYNNHILRKCPKKKTQPIINTVHPQNLWVASGSGRFPSV